MLNDHHNYLVQPQEPTGGAINFKIGGISKSPFTKPVSATPNTQEYVYVFNPADSQWTIHQTHGRIPSRRTHH